MTLRVTDPHMHLWDMERLPYGWLQTPGTNFLGDYSPLAKNHLPSDFLNDAGEVIVERTVHVEAVVDAGHSLEETRWLEELANDTGIPTAIIAATDLSAPDVEAQLEAQASHPRVRGVRQILNRHHDPVYNYVDADYLHDPAWKRGFDVLARKNLSFDLQLYPSQMADAAHVAGSNPETPIIVNHTGMFADRGFVNGWRQWRDGMKLLAGYPNVFVKISGLGMFDHNWSDESLRPYVLQTIDSFGTERAMFASNFPVDRLFSTYSELWSAFSRLTAQFSESERDALFRGNADRIYRLEATG